MNKFNNLFLLLLFSISLSHVYAQDNEAPVPFCHDEVINILAPNYHITVFANDFLSNSVDNFTRSENLRYTFSEVPPEDDPNFLSDKNSSYTELSIDVGAGQDTLLTSMDIWVWDEAGNSDYCSAWIQVYPSGPDDGSVNGSVAYVDENQLFGPEFEITLSNVFGPVYNRKMNFENGVFTYWDVPSGFYRLSGNSNEDLLNGTTTLDLVLTQKHILQILPFDNPVQYIAADISNDNIINVLDILQMGRGILAIYNEYPNNYSWRFVAADQDLEDLERFLKWGVEEYLYFNVNGNSVNRGFKAIKVGDVNGSYIRNQNDQQLLAEMVQIDPEFEKLIPDLQLKTNAEMVNFEEFHRNQDTVIVRIEEFVANPGDEICVPVTVENYVGVGGFQFPISWDKSMLEYKGFNDNMPNGVLAKLTDNNDELLVIYTGDFGWLESKPDHDTIIEICFNVLSDELQATNLSFETNVGYEKGVFNYLEKIPAKFIAGQLGLNTGCIDYWQVALGLQNNPVILPAEDLYIGEEFSDIVLVNGFSSISFDCGGIGEHAVNVTVDKEDDTSLTCPTTIEVVDKISPVLLVKDQITVTFDENLQFVLTPELLVNSVFDNCGEMAFRLEPEFLDCSTPNPTIVQTMVSDPSGNESMAFTTVNIIYPEHPANTLACKEEADIIIAPGENIELTAEYLLEGPMSCSGYYEVELYFDINFNQPQDDILLSTADVGNTYYAVVSDPQTGNECYTTIHILQGTGSSVVLSFPYETVGPNEEICLPLSVYNFNNIGGFQFPISWDDDILQLNEIVIPDESPVALSLNSNFNIHDSEVWVAWFDPAVTGVNMEDGDVLMELCFTAIGPYESSSPVDFYSESGFLQTEVISASGDALDFELVAGEVFIFGSGCVPSYTLELDAFGNGLLDAHELFYSEVPFENVSFIGEPTMAFNCEDLGENLVELLITWENNNQETCEVAVIIQDITPPVAIADQNITIELNEDLEFILTPDIIDDGSYDLCGSVSLQVDPVILDCNSSNPQLVRLTVTDESGNQNQVFTEVMISYPSHPANSIACNGEVTLTLTPNSEVNLTADLFLEGGQTCADYYNLFAYENNDTQQPLDDLIMDYTDGGNTYWIIVQDPLTGIECSSDLHIILEDCSEPFDEESIGWPCDIIVQSCEYTVFDLSPNILTDKYDIDPACAEPQLDLLDCHIVGVTYDDTVFEESDSSTLIRHWTVIDWLHYAAGSETGIYEYEQEIIVYQTDPETLVICDTLSWDTPTGNCESGHTLEDMVEWPADITVSSPQIHPISLGNNPNIHPYNVEPRLFGVCVSFDVAFEDELINDNNGQTIVERTWQIFDLTNNTVFEFMQIITIDGTLDIPVYCAYSISENPLSGVLFQDPFESGNSGCVTIPNISEGTIISPSKMDDWQSGLDLMDLITLYKAVLGAIELTPYQLIAADINQNGSVTTLDAVLLEGIIDGSIQMNETPWLFVDAKFVFENAGLNAVPNGYPSSITYENGSLGASFIGIKMGDINDSYQATSFTQNLETSYLKIKDEVLFKGNDYEMPVISNESYVLEGLKLAISVDEEVLEITGIKSNMLGELTVGEEAILEDGILHVDFSVSSLDLINETGIDLSAGDILFTIECKAIDNGLLHSAIQLSAEGLQLVKKQSSASPEKIQLEWLDLISGTKNLITNHTVELFPQPATDNINFLSDEEVRGTIVNIYNGMGQLVQSNKLNGNELDVSQLAEGAYIMILEKESLILNQLRLIIAR